MKLAVTSTGREMDSPVDRRFGRARYFIVIDEDGDGFEVIDNTESADLPGGAGVQTADNLARKGVEAVITGHCGPSAYRVLSAAGIKVYVGAGGTVASAVESFRKGLLQESENPDVEGHWS